LIGGQNGLRAQFAGGGLPEGGLEAHASAVLRQVLGQAPAQVGQTQRTTTNGLETVAIPARAQTQQGQVVDVAVTAYRVGDRAYHFLTIAPAGTAAPMTPMLRSMRQLSAQEADALRARQVELVQVGPRDTAQTLARRMAFNDYQLDRFLVLNGLDANTQLQAGDTVKIVTYVR
jgi:predicted Zn-dependent protease